MQNLAMDTSTRTASFPEIVDSTMISAFSDCPLKWYREYCLKLGSDVPNIHLHAGGAFARAIEVVRRHYYEGGCSVQESIEKAFIEYIRYWGDFEAPQGSPKSFERMWQALMFYFEEYPLETDNIQPYELGDGKKGIEFTFAIPLPVMHPETKQPILYAGRADMLGYYNNLVAVIDEKTASALGASWANQWKMRGQFLGYCWAAQQHGIPATTAIIRGVGILKTKFTTVQVIQSYPQHLIDKWYRTMIGKVDMMAYYYNSNYSKGESRFPMNFGNACSLYGGCFFTDLCQTNVPEEWYGDYGVRNWNPLHMNPTGGE